MLHPEDFVPVLLYIMVRDGLPWLMRTVFPAWYKAREHKYSGELEIRKIELRLQEEAAKRDGKLEERTAKALEEISGYMKSLNESTVKNTIQLTTLRAEVANINDSQSEYFREGRVTMKEIAVISRAAKKKTKPR